MVSYDNVKESCLKKLKKYGFNEVKTKGKHELIRYDGPCTLILYKTGKLLLQGNKEKISEIEQILDYHCISDDNKIGGIAVGSDETLKGDTFGGIVVCAFKADDNIRKELKKLGVKDSKQLLKPEIVKLAKELIKKYPKKFHVESIFPLDYNKMNLKMNVTEILNKLHLKCYKKISKKDLHIVDLYPGCTVGNIKQTQADSKYLEVAAASIIARYFGLKQIRELEMRAGFFIPLGSSHVENGLLEIRKKTLDPKDYVKLKFKNVRAFFE